MIRPLTGAVFLLLALACPRPATHSSGGAGPGDASFVVDGGCVIVGLNCNQAGDCASPCGADQSCVDACQGAACASANTTFEAVRSCTIHNCWNKCLSGDSPQCSACSAEKCAAEQAACDADQCPVTCAADGGVPDASVPPRDAGTTGGSCGAVYDCMGMCLVETPFLCIGFCKARACDAANSALDALLQCAEAQCRTSTDGRCNDRYSTHECQACMEERCPAAWTTCQATAC